MFCVQRGHGVYGALRPDEGESPDPPGSDGERRRGGPAPEPLGSHRDPSALPAGVCRRPAGGARSHPHRRPHDRDGPGGPGGPSGEEHQRPAVPHGPGAQLRQPDGDGVRPLRPLCLQLSHEPEPGVGLSGHADGRAGAAPGAPSGGLHGVRLLLLYLSLTYPPGGSGPSGQTVSKGRRRAGMSQNGPVIRRSSPQIAQVSSISSTMLDVIVALLPALGMAVYLFGPRVLALTLVSVAACVGAEYGYRRLMGLSNTVGDLSACVTGLLLAMSLPVTAPYWAPVLGGVFSIVVVKQFYGGLGRNFMNPALAGRALLCTFPGLMTTWVDAFQKTPLFGAVDAVSSPTPMALLHAGALPDLTLSQLMLGQHGGAMGGAPVFMLLLGGVYLVGRRVISPRIPLSYLGTVALLTLLFPRGNGGALAWMTAQLCSGGLVLGAVFMASDYTTTPVTPVGQTLFGMGCGVLTVLLRYFGSYPDGVGWAILTMNCCVWLLDRAALPRRFGVGRFEAVRGWAEHLRASAAAIHFVPPKVKFLARAGDGTMPGEGYLDELRGTVRQLAALAAVFAVTCGMVFGVHRATDYAAVRAETAAQQTLLAQVMPQATVRSETPYRAPGALSITAGYNDSGLVGYCVEVQANGFGGVLTAVVGVNTNGEVTGVAVTDHRETVGVGTQALKSGYLSQYTGRSGTIRTSGSNAVEAVSGATATSEAVTSCVNQALAIVASLDTEGKVDYVDGEV